ncbi:hypothetical protein EYF80_011743 [Liparis tanakae]|uniref:Uncharacterized protein n=1 Tax=Liparis tanakae TaxID=230148 RepID=A0A4Z2IIZ5_9TELE|nr:hypothetical protein EYF80_011743 [Liparis tanakae]
MVQQAEEEEEEAEKVESEEERELSGRTVKMSKDLWTHFRNSWTLSRRFLQLDWVGKWSFFRKDDKPKDEREEDNICIKGHYNRDALGSIGVAMLLDGKTSGIALFNSEHAGEEGDVPQHHIMKKGPQDNAEKARLWDSI